jgi:hypothetical protein
MSAVIAMMVVAMMALSYIKSTTATIRAMQTTERSQDYQAFENAFANEMVARITRFLESIDGNDCATGGSRLKAELERSFNFSTTPSDPIELGVSVLEPSHLLAPEFNYKGSIDHTDAIARCSTKQTDFTSDLSLRSSVYSCLMLKPANDKTNKTFTIPPGSERLPVFVEISARFFDAAPGSPALTALTCSGYRNSSQTRSVSLFYAIYWGARDQVGRIDSKMFRGNVVRSSAN